MPALRACRCSCSRSRSRQSGCTSTSSRAPSTSTCSCSPPIRARTARPSSTTPSGTSTRGNPPAAEMPLTFALLLNLVAASNAHDKDVLWGFIRRHAQGVSPETHPLLDQLAGYAVRYYADFVKPRKKYRPADDVETAALRALSDVLKSAPAERHRRGAAGHHLRRRPRHSALSGSQRQGRDAGTPRRLERLVQRDLRGAAGRGEGPALRQLRRSSTAIKETRALIDKALNGELTKAA